MRFRDERPGDLDRARAAAAAWRDQNPEGTPKDLIAAVPSVSGSGETPGATVTGVT